MKGTRGLVEESMLRQPKCKTGKVIFDKKTAQTKKNALEHRGREKALRIYQCPTCNWWHLTKIV